MLKGLSVEEDEKLEEAAVEEVDIGVRNILERILFTAERIYGNTRCFSTRAVLWYDDTNFSISSANLKLLFMFTEIALFLLSIAGTFSGELLLLAL